MSLIKGEKINVPISDQYTWSFDISENGVYAVAISAKCKNWSQNFRHLFNDDDLAVQIDESFFSSTKGKKKEFNTPGSWNGNEIKGKTKVVLFILPLKAGTHAIKFWVDVAPVLDEIKIYRIEESEIDLITSGIVASGKFLDIVSNDLKIEKLEIRASAKVGSNLQIKIDGETQKNPKYKKFAKWFWYGQELKGNSKVYDTLEAWGDNPHTLELSGQGEPEIESIKLKINMDALVYSRGVVRLYKDLGVNREDVNLREDSNSHSKSLLMVQDGQRVNVLEERAKGEYIENYSEIWHKVIFNGKTGYILSSFVEIEGQERDKIIDLIKEKSNKYGVDANIMLAIASRESHFKPFAKSSTGPMGIFQLSEDTRKDVKVSDPYNFYQNIDGGVQHYKWIEGQITGRGDVFERRLVAWHDGTKNIKGKKSLNYNELSGETKNFIKNVLANLEKKDWYHIIALPIIFLFFFPYLNNFFDQITNETYQANIKNFNYPVALVLEASNTPKTNFFSSIFNEKKDKFDNFYSYRPNVFLDEKTGKIKFIDSVGKLVSEFKTARLDIDRLQGVDGIMANMTSFDDDFVKNTSISNAVLENPKGVFYFGALNRTTCGASNCHYVLYKFDSNTNVLRMMDPDIFGEILGLYLSPDSKYIAVFSESFGGFCNNHGDIKVFNTTTFSARQPNWFLDDKFGTQTIKNIIWKNNDELKFQAEYQSDCRTGIFLQNDWLYNLPQDKLIKIKSQTLERPMS